ncbi:MAG: rhomboid family intramembrane serine protease [Leptospiraceae bacterium]|nr:rhomboid family intramembrane serine protease [Leptospiraceae bacterium]
MELLNLPILTFYAVIIIIVISIRAFKDKVLFERYQLSTEGILVQKMYFKYLYSGFIHLNPLHLVFNSIALISFGMAVEMELGKLGFLSIFFGSIISGSLFAIYNNRFNPHYVAIGASGGISGLITAYALIHANAGVSFFFIPFSIPAWIFCILALLISYNGVNQKHTGVCHEGHIAGAAFGYFSGVAINLYRGNFPALETLSIGFVFLMITAHYYYKWSLYINSDIKEIITKIKTTIGKIKSEKREREMDMILEKISQNGIKSLSFLEKKRLAKYSTAK